MAASRKFLQSINLVNLDIDPDGGAPGDIYYNTLSDKIRYFNGTSWSDLGSGSGSLTEPLLKLDFDTTSTVAQDVARLKWNDGDGTFEFGLKGGNVNLQLGQEQVALCYNGTGSTIPEGSVVYINGAQGQRPSVALARADSESTSAYVFGVATENISSGSEGFITTFGVIHSLNTLSLTEGAAIWLSPTNAGQFTTTKPSAPNHLVQIGFVVRSHATSGQIFVRNQNGYEINELHDVGISSVANNDVLIYDSTLGYWKNQLLLTSITNIDGSGSGIDADLLDGNHGSYYAPISSPTFSGTPAAPTAAVDTNTTQIATTAYVVGQGYLKSSSAASTYQPLDGDLTTIASLTGTGILQRTGANTWSFISTSNYLTVSDAASTYLTISSADSTYATHADLSSGYQPLDGDLTSIAGLTGTSGYLKKTDANTWSLDTKTFIDTSTATQSMTSNLTITGDLTVTNLTVTGTQNIINTSNLSITDPLIYLSNNQFDTDAVDIGIYGAYGDANPGHHHTGLVRDHTDGTWHLFSNGAEPTSNTVSLTGVVYDKLHLGTIQVESTTMVTNLNADMLDGNHATSFALLSGASFTGSITSNAASPAISLTGTPSATASVDGLLNIGSINWSDTNILAGFAHNINSYAQVVIQNKSAGGAASADLIISNDTGSASANYLDLGINSSGFSGGGVWDSPNGSYLYANGGSMTVGTQGSNALILATGNTARATLDANGTLTIPTNASGTVNALTLSGTPSSASVSRGLLQVSGSVGYSDAGMIASFVGDINNYSQVVLQNKNAGSSASADFIVNNNSSTASTTYGDFGINSSAYSGTGPFDLPNDVYLYSIGTDIVVGTRSSHNIFMATNNATRITISDTSSTFSNATAVDVANTASISSFTVNSSSWLTGSNTAYGLLRVGDAVVANTNLIASFGKSINSYVSTVFENPNAGAAASVDLVFQNNQTTTSAASVYGDIGLSSSAYTAGDAFNQPNLMYMYMNGGNLAVGTSSNNSFKVVTGTASTERLDVSGTGLFTFATGTRLVLPAHTTNASLNLTPGTGNPGSPSDGDVWINATGMYARIAGATVGPFAASSGTVSLSANNSWTGTNTFSQPIISTFQNTASLGAIAVTAAQRTQTSSRGQIHVGPDLPSADTTLGYVGVSSASTFFQNILQNTSNGTAASVDLVLYNDATSNGGNTLYFDLGLNSSTFTGSGPFDDANGSYIYMDTGTLSVGTTTSHTFRIATNTVSRIEVSGTGAISVLSGTTFSTESSTLLSTTLRTSATASTSVNSAGITIQTGNATGTTSSSGTVTIDTGTGTTAAGTVSIGTTNAPTVTIGKTTGSMVGYPAAGTTTTATTSAGYMGMPQNLNPTSPYTLVAADAGKHIYFTTGTNTLTIPANTVTAFPIGTTIVVANSSSTSLSITINTDTLRLAGSSTSPGSRILTQYGMATLLKVTATEWWISGNGVA